MRASDNGWALAPGVRLRRLELHDAGALFGLVERNRARLRPWMLWVDEVDELVDVARFISESQRVTDVGPVAFECGILVRGHLRGAVGLNRFEWTVRSGNLGYWVDASIEGHGFVTKASRRLVDFGFEVLGLERIEVRAAKSNGRSRAVAERAGLWYEGTLRGAEVVEGARHDVVVYGLLRTDPRIEPD